MSTPLPKLTDREMQVATRLSLGKNHHEIGDDLKIAVKTVDTHRIHIMKKLNLRNNVELARHALLQGWVAL